MGFRTIFGHQMMKMASKMGVLSSYQFRARSSNMAIGCVLMKCLSYDMARLLCALMCMFDCDAHVCYDRMIPSQCLTQGARIGVHEGPIKLQLCISRNMKYHIKTAYSISKKYFITTLQLTILGMMQGSTVVRAFWGLTSSLIFACLSKWHKPTRFPSPRE